MANENAPHTNTSQFFITLDACEHLKVRYIYIYYIWPVGE